MAGVKGRAGAKDVPPVKIDQAGMDMLELLQKIALGEIDASPTQVRAAAAAIPYTHGKVSEGGKKQERAAAAKVAAGKFAATPAPLKLVKRG